MYTINHTVHTHYRSMASLHIIKVVVLDEASVVKKRFHREANPNPRNESSEGDKVPRP